MAVERHLYEYRSGPHSVELLFPNDRGAALGSLGFQTVYHLFNSQPEFSAGMSFFDPQAKVSGKYSAREILALSIAYELDAANFLRFLLNRGLEPIACNRKGPLVVAGGVLSLINPLPLAPFVDLFMIGDGEELIPRFARIYQDNHRRGKEALMQAFTAEPGFWLPENGMPAEFEPAQQPRSLPLHSVIISEEAHFGEMFLVEVGRGCPRRCRFCASSHIHSYEYHPLDRILEVIEDNVSPPITVGLIGSALSDYPDMQPLLAKLVRKGYGLGLSSLRPDAITPQLAELMIKGGVKTLTLAPEAGSLRLRRITGKGMTDETIYRSAQYALEAGISRLKLYLLIGLPGETEEDIDSLIAMARRIAEMGPRGWLEVSVNAFVPKAHTPWQWAGFAGQNYIKKTRTRIRKELKNIGFTRRSSTQELVNAVISAGDETVGLALYDSLLEEVSLKQALRRRGGDWKAYVSEKDSSYTFPWDGLSCSGEKESLMAIWKMLRTRIS